MPDLLLPDLEVRNYRIFRELRIPRLGRVVLLTGKNGVGKTALLEALRIYALRGSPRVLGEILETRGEVRSAVRARGGDPNPDGEVLLRAVQNLFHGREAGPSVSRSLVVGPSSETGKLSVSLTWDGPEAQSQDDRGNPGASRAAQAGEHLHPSIVVDWPCGRKTRIDLDQWEPFSRAQWYLPAGSEDEVENCVHVAPAGLSGRAIAGFWDSVSLTPSEETVVSGLRLVTPGVERISLSADPHNGSSPTVRARVAGETVPVLLQSLGDGMNRIFGITLALVNARNGFLLVDEIENGIHYSVQIQLWKLIFGVAEQLDVQVFATTHSFDCIRAFQEAARESPEAGVLVRLNKSPSGVSATVFDEDDLAVVADEEIEVR